MTNMQCEIVSACVLRIISTGGEIVAGVRRCVVSSDAGQEYSCTAGTGVT